MYFVYTKKYLFKIEMRRTYISASIALWTFLITVVVWLFSVLMRLAPIESQSDRNAGLLAAAVWFGTMLACLKPLSKSGYSFDVMRLRYTHGNKINVFTSKRRYQVDLQKPFFICRIPIYFLFKKQGHIQWFYLFSNVAMESQLSGTEGVEKVYQILRAGGALLPVNEEITQWIYAECKLPVAPCFPRFGYHPGINIGSGEDMR